MKGTCRALGGIVLVLGIIGTLVLAIAGGKTASVDYSMYSGVGVEYHRSWLLTFGYLIGGGLTTAFASTVFFALAEILDDLESVKYLQSEMMENIHEMQVNASNKSDSSNAEGESNFRGNDSASAGSIYGFSGSGGWTCPECNRKNRSFDSSCVCGYYKG